MRKISVTDKNQITLEPGGTYQMDLAGPDEQMVCKLHILAHFCDLAADEVACTSENYIICGEKIEDLARNLYESYAKFISAGLDIFSYPNYADGRALRVYHNRPIINGKFNAGPNEQPGVPGGWFYDFPSTISKYFHFGKIVIIKNEQTFKITNYEDDEGDQNVISCIELNSIGDISMLQNAFPSIWLELLNAISYINNNERI